MYDVTRRSSFEHLAEWLKEIERYTPGAGAAPVKLLVGNKLDLDVERQVTRHEGEAWAREHGMLVRALAASLKWTRAPALTDSPPRPCPAALVVHRGLR